MAKKKPAPAGNVIQNCNFTVQAPAPETEANVERRVEAVTSLAAAAQANAEAIRAVAEALRGPASTSDNTCIKIGS